MPRISVGSLRHNGFLRNVAALAGSTAVSQVVLLAVGPVLTRLYGPDAMGVYGLVMAFVAVAQVVTALCYDQAIVGTRSPGEAAALTGATLLLGPVVSAVAVSVLWLLIAGNRFGYGEVPLAAVWWTFVVLVVMQVFVSLRYWHMRAERFGLLARTMITQNLGRAFAPIVAASFLGGWAGLISGEAVGRLFGIAPLIRERRTELRRALTGVTPRRALAGLRRYSVFAFVGVPSGLLNALAQAIPVPFLGAAFGSAAVGQYVLAQRVLQAPLGLIGRSVADAFHARLATHARDRREYVYRFFLKTAALLAASALVPVLLVALLGPAGFGWIFGARWGKAGSLALAMLPWSVGALVVTPLSRAVFVLGGQRQKLVYDLSALALVCAACAMCRHYGLGLVSTVAWLSGGQAVAYLIYFAVLVNVVRSGMKWQEPHA